MKKVFGRQFIIQILQQVTSKVFFVPSVLGGAGIPDVPKLINILEHPEIITTT